LTEGIHLGVRKAMFSSSVPSDGNDLSGLREDSGANRGRLAFKV
jgi:hypothetical protein